MTLVEQILLGLIVVVIEIVLFSAVLVWGLQEQWRGLDKDPEEAEKAG